MKGRVNRWFQDRGFGFLYDEADNSYFVHISQIENQEELMVGDIVEFEKKETEKGLMAVNVKVLQKYINAI